MKCEGKGYRKEAKDVDGGNRERGLDAFGQDRRCVGKPKGQNGERGNCNYSGSQALRELAKKKRRLKGKIQSSMAQEGEVVSQQWEWASMENNPKTQGERVLGAASAKKRRRVSEMTS